VEIEENNVDNDCLIAVSSGIISRHLRYVIWLLRAKIPKTLAVAKVNVCDLCYDLQVAQLLQRDRTAGWVSYRQKWKTGTARQYIWTL